MAISGQVSQNPNSFRIEAAEGLRSLRLAIAGMIEHLPTPADRPLELARNLGIDKSLASKISRLLSEPGDPLAAATLLPGKAALEAFVRAARASGANATQESAVLEAMSTLDQVASRHAGDRTSFALMLNACAADAETPATVALRRSAFRANSAMFGVQAKVQYKLVVVGPSRDGVSADMARVRGFVSLLRLRPDVAWTVSRSRVVDDAGRPGAEHPCSRPLPIGPDGGERLLLPSFSSANPPEVVVTPLGDGTIEEQILPGPVGNEGAFTVLTADFIERVGPLRRTPGDRYAASGLSVHTPVETLLFDYIVHQDNFDQAEPEFAVYSQLGCPPWPACGESKRLPMHAPVQSFGRGVEFAQSLSVPRFREIISAVFEDPRWSPGDFLHFRVRVPFPPIPCTAVMRHDLPST